MIRRLTAILLLLAITAQSFSQSLIILDYYAHRSTYIQRCENKARPMLHCNGKCQMMKKLKEDNNKNQQQPFGKLDVKTEIISSNSYFAKASLGFDTNRSKPIDWQNMFILQTPIKAIYHPPRAAASQYLIVFIR